MGEGYSTKALRQRAREEVFKRLFGAPPSEVLKKYSTIDITRKLIRALVDEPFWKSTLGFPLNHIWVKIAKETGNLHRLASLIPQYPVKSLIPPSDELRTQRDRIIPLQKYMEDVETLHKKKDETGENLLSKIYKGTSPHRFKHSNELYQPALVVSALLQGRDPLTHLLENHPSPKGLHYYTNPEFHGEKHPLLLDALKMDEKLSLTFVKPFLKLDPSEEREVFIFTPSSTEKEMLPIREVLNFYSLYRRKKTITPHYLLKDIVTSPTLYFVHDGIRLYYLPAHLFEFISRAYASPTFSFLKKAAHRWKNLEKHLEVYEKFFGHTEISKDTDFKRFMEDLLHSDPYDNVISVLYYGFKQKYPTHHYREMPLDKLFQRRRSPPSYMPLDFADYIQNTLEFLHGKHKASKLFKELVDNTVGKLR